MESVKSHDVFTQEELDEALDRADGVPVCAGDGEFTVGGSAFARAVDSVRVRVAGDAVVEAGGAATVHVAGDASVVVRDRVVVEAAERASVRAGDQSIVRAGDATSVFLSAFATGQTRGRARVSARGQTSLIATEDCDVRAHERARVAAHGRTVVKAWNSATVQAFDETNVIAWGSASVRAVGEARVEARESSFVEAGGRARVRALGASIVRARGRAAIDALGHVSVTVHGPGVEVTGGAVTRVPVPATAEEWCEFYGVEARDGVATLYKAVDRDFNSYHGMSYAPGSQPTAPDWDGGERECGGGIHLSPYPALAVPRTYGATRFVACPVRLAEIVTYPGGDYPDTVKAPGVCAPVYEVDEQGRPLRALDLI